MAVLTAQPLANAGLKPVFSAASAGGDSFANTGNEYVHIKNGSASSITVTIDSVAPCSYGFDHDLAITIPAGEEKLTPRLARARFNDTDGFVTLTYSASASVTVAVIKV